MDILGYFLQVLPIIAIITTVVAMALFIITAPFILLIEKGHIIFAVIWLLLCIIILTTVYVTALEYYGF